MVTNMFENFWLYASFSFEKIIRRVFTIELVREKVNEMNARIDFALCDPHFKDEKNHLDKKDIKKEIALLIFNRGKLAYKAKKNPYLYNSLYTDTDVCFQAIIKLVIKSKEFQDSLK